MEKQDVGCGFRVILSHHAGQGYLAALDVGVAGLAGCKNKPPADKSSLLETGSSNSKSRDITHPAASVSYSLRVLAAYGN